MGGFAAWVHREDGGGLCVSELRGGVGKPMVVEERPAKLEVEMEGEKRKRRPTTGGGFKKLASVNGCSKCAFVVEGWPSICLQKSHGETLREKERIRKIYRLIALRGLSFDIQSQEP
ncbi:Uncharacterized protein Fot_26780 [Forsythia ovata]|uniref:Uncharacterized protein n=1 Tax=Forsythia ovata TaxID=205694 RepID=A0ABD1UCX9_9LAMI